MIGVHRGTAWSGKPDTYGWGIYLKMCERRKLLSTLSGELDFLDYYYLIYILHLIPFTGARFYAQYIIPKKKDLHSLPVSSAFNSAHCV